MKYSTLHCIVFTTYFEDNPKDLSNSQDISKMDEEEIILEEEKILSENVDENIMELIKTESAEMNIQIYVLSVISLGL